MEAVNRRTQELERSNKDLVQFAYVASHDLRAPVRAIKSFSQILEKDYREKLDEQANECLDFIVSGAGRLETLINDLLTYYTGDDQTTLEAVIENLEDTALTAEPGANWRYSNFGYQILLVVLERASGKSYGELLQDEIFASAGMDDSGLIAPAHSKGQPKGSAPVPGLARGYNGEPGNLETANSLMYINLGAGGVYATARDMLRYDDLLRKGEFLDCDTQRIMFDRGMKASETVTYGYGWIIREPEDGIYTFEHSGGNNGYTSQYLRVPRHGICIVLLSNLGFAPVGDLGRSILEVMLAES